jgi:hypothetical protein
MKFSGAEPNTKECSEVQGLLAQAQVPAPSPACAEGGEGEATRTEQATSPSPALQPKSDLSDFGSLLVPKSGRPDFG